MPAISFIVPPHTSMNEPPPMENQMPIYEYKCRDCGEKYEKLVRSVDRQEHPPCPQCGSPKAERQISLCGCMAAAADRGAAPAAPGSCAPSGNG
jgi:putative FmdB family regulatory protein